MEWTWHIFWDIYPRQLTQKPTHPNSHNVMRMVFRTNGST